MQPGRRTNNCPKRDFFLNSVTFGKLAEEGAARGRARARRPRDASKACCCGCPAPSDDVVVSMSTKFTPNSPLPRGH